MINKVYEIYLKANRIISTDTRNIIPGSLFFALKGENFDGNKFAQEAIQKGAIAAVIDNPSYTTIPDTLLVNDTLKTLQDLACLHRSKNQFQVIGLTGSNGKTTTKELINVVLSSKYNCHATRGNLNNHIGVPLTILSTPPEADFLIVEMGANHINEIKHLCLIAKPDFGLVTNIGKAHLDGFGGIEGVIKAKSELYDYLITNNKPIFINGVDNILLKQVNKYNNIHKYSSKDSGCYSRDTFFEEGLNTTISAGDKTFTISTKLFGEYNLTNILAAVKIGRYFQVNNADIQSAISNYTPNNNRSQILKTTNNTVILDSYNANPSSMNAALKSFNDIRSNEKVLILGEMKELGPSSPDEHTKLSQLANKIKPKYSFVVGNEFKKVKLQKEKYFESVESLAQYLNENVITNSIILVKGSRSNQLEKILPYL